MSGLGGQVEGLGGEEVTRGRGTERVKNSDREGARNQSREKGSEQVGDRVERVGRDGMSRGGGVGGRRRVSVNCGKQ